MNSRHRFVGLLGLLAAVGALVTGPGGLVVLMSALLGLRLATTTGLIVAVLRVTGLSFRMDREKIGPSVRGCCLPRARRYTAKRAESGSMSRPKPHPAISAGLGCSRASGSPWAERCPPR